MSKINCVRCGLEIDAKDGKSYSRIHLGAQEITSIYIGEKEVTKAYPGDKRVFDKNKLVCASCHKGEIQTPLVEGLNPEDLN